GGKLLVSAAGEVPRLAAFATAAREDKLGLLTERESAARIAYQRLDGGAVAVARADVPSESVGSFVLSAALFALVVTAWAPICAFILGRAVTSPVERLISTTERIVAEGKQSEMAALPVVRNDEVGRLSERFNDLLDMMRDL